MLIAGAGGHSREIYDIIKQIPDIYVFEEYETNACDKWNKSIRFIREYGDIKNLFEHAPEFLLGVGDPDLREKFFTKLLEIKGIPQSVISPASLISTENVTLETGLNIMAFAFISNNVTIKMGTLLNTGCRVHHDCTIGEFCQISPNVTITGNCSVGNKCSIGTSATILPGITIGNNVVIGAGSVVTKNIADNQIVMGIPAKAKK